MVVFYILSFANSAVIRGNCGMSFVANFLENTIVKKFRKSANICQSHERMYSGTVFWLTV